MIHRRQIIKTLGIASIFGTALIPKTFGSELTPITIQLINRIDQWRKVTNSPIELFDDHRVYDMKRFAIYAWTDDPTNEHCFSTDIYWSTEEQKEDSNFVMKQLLNYYNAKLIGEYKTNTTYQPPGKIMRIQI